MDVGTFPAGMRVLAVDDDGVSLKIIAKQLRICKYDVTTAMCAETALEMLRERKGDNQLDLVITDVHMPDMDGFKLLELIGLEMDIPVIMLSANDEKETMMKGIKHGACDYLVKPVHLEQIRKIWVHVLKKSTSDPRNRMSGGNDDARQKLQPGGTEGEKDGANSTRKYSRKSRKDGDGPEEDRKNTAQKRPRVRWSVQLHHKFVEVVNQIGMDRAVPKKILEMMNVDGLSRENIASHLQKYRIYLKRFSEGTVRHSNLFAGEPEGYKWNPNDMNGLQSFKNHPEHGRYQPSPSFAGSSNSSNPFPMMNSPSAFGSGHDLLPTQSVQLMNSERNLGIHLKDMGPVGHGGNLLKDAVPGSQQDASKFISPGNSYTNISNVQLNVQLSGTSKCFLSGPSGSSVANSSNSMAFNTSKSFPFGTSGNSSANISNDSPPLAASISFPSSCSIKSYASILRGKLLGATRGIPFDADNTFGDIADGDMLASSSHLPVQSPELVNQPSVQIQSSSADLFSKDVREAPQFAGLSNSSNSWKTAVPLKFPNVGHKDGTSEGPLQENSLKIKQPSRFAASSGQMPTFGNECQNQMAALMKKTAPVVGFSDQMALFNLGSNINSTGMPNCNSALGSASSIRSSLPNLQMNNSVMPTQTLNGEGASGNLPEKDGTVDQQAVSDQLNNINESRMGTSEAQNRVSGDSDDFFSDWLNQDFFNNGDAFMDGDWEFIP
ncbi:two-component response regulator ORR25-like [Phragmites australis]|uniref:two-component response regulator ORR25-like n=1 Tax=Phragmites australis TaxID=29695 RepID=UPI002D768BC9|nr:two-component response regulator ORR25-like [Phragmites australis]